jgi:hypothetical protein
VLDAQAGYQSHQCVSQGWSIKAPTRVHIGPLELPNAIPEEGEIEKDDDIVLTRGFDLSKGHPASRFGPFMAELVVREYRRSFRVCVKPASSWSGGG